ELLIIRFGLVGFPRENARAAPSEARHRTDRVVYHHSGMVDNLLKLRCRGSAVPDCQPSLAPEISRIERDSISKLVRRRGCKRLNRVASISVPQGDGGMDHRDPFELRQ